MFCVSVRVCILLVRMFFHSDERVFCVVRVFCMSMRVFSFNENVSYMSECFLFC